MPRALSPETVAALEERGRAGVSASKIADEFGVSIGTADKYARAGRARAGLIPRVEPHLDTPRSIMAAGNGFTVRLVKMVDAFDHRVSYTVFLSRLGTAKGSRFTDMPAAAAIDRFIIFYRQHIAGAAA